MLLAKFQSRFNAFWNRLNDHVQKKGEEDALKKKITKYKIQKELTNEQKKEVQTFYKSLIGKNVPLYSHEYFYSRSGVFSKEYVPIDLYYLELLPRANRRNVQAIYCDKNMLDVLVQDEKHPHIYLKNMNGFFYFEGRSVTRAEAVELCRNLGVVIVKPSLSSKGNGVQKITLKDGVVVETQQSVAELFNQYSVDYNIQECIQQHERMSALNPTSVNTIRVLSYRFEDEVKVVYAVVRIGRKGKVIDNQSAGGISVTIDECGRLGKYGVAGAKENGLEKTDLGIVLDGYQLPSYEKAMEMVIRLHSKFPYSKILGWDIAIGADGEPMLLEVNTRPGLSQSAFGSGMGKYTEKIIRELWKRPNTRFKNI